MEPQLLALRNTRGDAARISPHGAQLLSWQPAGEREQLYWSTLSPTGAGRAVRGGVPVCFPQFSDRGPLPKHGIVRTRTWRLVEQGDGEIAQARLALAEDGRSGPFPFALELAVRLGPRWIEVQLQARNTGTAPFAFTGALHTYLAVDDVRQLTLRGLQGCDYQDALAANALRREADAALRFAGELDRVYLATPRALELSEGASLRRIAQEGFTDTVVWNPGPDKAARLGDMPPADWTRMLCIEAAVVGTPLTVAPGASWHGIQRIELA